MILRIDCNLQPEKLSLLGVSGGPDSMCLLHILYRLHYKLLVVHVNHQLRPEADEEARTVESFVHSLGMKFVSFRVDVKSYAGKHSLSLEEAAREMRYQVLFEQAEDAKAQAVLVAHNADDQIETILLHILRGSGLTGLRGMEHRTVPNRWSEHISLVRPLISTWREEIVTYLDQQAIRYTTDFSNFNKIYLRNRIRHELLPYLAQYNPRIRENLLRMGQINKDDYAVIQQFVTKAWEISFVKHGPGYAAFRLPEFQKLPPSIQRYVVRKGIALYLPSLRDIDFNNIQNGIQFLCDDSKRGQSDLIAGLRLLKEGELFWLATWQADLPQSDFPIISSGEEMFLEVPSTLPLNNNWILKADVENNVEQAVQQGLVNCDPFQAWFDLDRVELPLLVRNRNPGERFQPLGMNGHSLKVSDLMINIKMLKRARATWPMVCTGDLILWIPGVRQSHLARIQPDTRRVAHLTLSKRSSS